MDHRVPENGGGSSRSQRRENGIILVRHHLLDREHLDRLKTHPARKIKQKPNVEFILLLETGDRNHQEKQLKAVHLRVPAEG